MAGAVPHVFAGFFLLAIIHYIHFKWEYSWAAFVGSLLPDVLKFGFSAAKQSTANILALRQDSFYVFMNSMTSNPANWFSLGFFLFGLTLMLYHFHYIRKKKMEEYDELFVFLLVGIILHLTMDVLFIEHGVWF